MKELPIADRMPITAIKLPEDLEYVALYPFADLQKGDKNADGKAAKEFLNCVLDDPNGYLVVAGDLMNNALKNSKSDIYQEEMPPNEQVERIIALLKPLAEAGKILCMVDGNHERRTALESGISPTVLLAAKLNISDRYFPIMAYIKLEFGKHPQNGRQRVYTILVHHGSGNGTTKGGMINKIEKFLSCIVCDLAIFGHWHDPMGANMPTLFVPDLHNNKLRMLNRKFMVATGWLQYGGYPTEKMLPARPIEPNKAILWAAKKRIQIVQG